MFTDTTNWDYYDNTDTRINYNGTWYNGDATMYGSYKGDISYASYNSTDNKYTFYFLGDKFQIYDLSYSTRSWYIITIDETFTDRIDAFSANTLKMIYEKLDLKNGYHKVEVKTDYPNYSSQYIGLDCIALNKGATLLSETEYNDIIAAEFLINDNGTYKNYDDTNNVLTNVTDVDRVFTDKTGIKINMFNKLIPHLSTLSKGWKLISNKDFKLIANGIKVNASAMATLEPLSMKSYASINSITTNYKIENNGAIKFIFSFDKGTTWKTYDISNSTWIDLNNITIPIKLYENFDDTDKTNWNNAKTEILTNGVDARNLGNIDFKSLTIDNLMFVIAFNRPSYADTCTLNKLNINYDGVAVYDQLAVGSDLSKYEAKVSITGDTIGVTTAKDVDKLLVAMTTNI